MTGKPANNDGARWRKVEAGEVVVSKAAADVLTTSAPVGSCVAVCLWDPTSGVGGLLHFLWPDSKLNPEQAESTPACFADTGVRLLFEQAGLMGADKGALQGSADWRGGDRRPRAGRSLGQAESACGAKRVVAERRVSRR